MAEPMKVAVTGAAGAIGYSLLFRIAAGEMLGEDQPVELRMLEISDAMEGLEGVAMELDDCAFPLLTRMDLTDDAKEAFDGANVCLLVGGTPATTNCLIAMNHAPDVPEGRFTAMTRLDHNRALAQLADKVSCSVSDISDMGVWGNHSPTMYPDLFNAKVKGEIAAEVIDDQQWIEDIFLPTVGKRGAAIIEARGASSAASAASAAIDHVRDWALGADDWRSMAIPSDGSYDVPEGLISSFPCTCSGGGYEIVQGLELNDFSRSRIDATVNELKEERKAV